MTIATAADYEQILTGKPTDSAGHLLKLLVATNPAPETVGEAMALVQQIRETERSKISWTTATAPLAR